MANSPSPDIELLPLNGSARPLSEWVTTFHLVLVVVDPYTYESSWLLDTAARIMEFFRGTDARMAWLVCGDTDAAHEFLGPLADQFLTFVDADRELVKAIGLETLPAVVHLDHGLRVQGVAQGWDPDEWREFTDHLSELMSWNRPMVPDTGDPNPFAGTPAL